MKTNKLIVETKKLSQNIPCILFSNCIPVKGYRRSIIYDSTRSDFHFIPNSLYEILTTEKGKSLEEIKNAHENKYDETIDEYFRFLFENELVFFCNQPEVFPDLSLEWKTPSGILQAVIDFNGSTKHDLKKISKELCSFNCKNLQLRFFDSVDYKKLSEILETFKYSTLKGIEILMPFNEHITGNDFNELVKKHPRITYIEIFNAPNHTGNTESNINISYSHNNIPDETSCGIIDRSLFALRFFNICESQEHNTCLNRKIGIDVKGEIKNCPSMNKSFGNTKDTSLQEAIERQGFKDVWFIHKDQIDVCKDCEFRHMCTDCRAYLKDQSDIYSQPKKCNYNPYIAKWDDEDGYVTVEEWRDNIK